MMQGDAYYLMQGDERSVVIDIMNGDQPLTLADVENLEVTFGSVRKTSADGGIAFSDGSWLMFMSQEETFALRPGSYEVQARVLWKDETVEGVDLGRLRVVESESKVVL